MSKLTKRGTISFALFLVLLAAPALSLSQDEVPVSQATIFTYTHDLLKIFYPEFFDKKFRLTLCATAPGDNDWLELGGVYFVFTPRDVDPLQKLVSGSPEPPDHVFLGGSIWLPPHPFGRVMEIQISSEAIHQHEIQKLGQLVKSHPEWSEMQVANALKEAGAQFGPADKEAFVNSLPLSGAARFLGQLTVTTVEFNYPGTKEVGHRETSELGWTVRADAVLANGTQVRYALEFEPFEGKLTSLRQFEE